MPVHRRGIFQLKFVLQNVGVEAFRHDTEKVGWNPQR
jgi:hypothetical protein